MMKIYHSSDRFAVRNRLFELAVSGSNQDGVSYIVVPDQFSFDSEKKLYEMRHKIRSANVEIVTFSSLAKIVFEREKIPPKPYLSKGAQLILTDIAMMEVSDRLNAFTDTSGNNRIVPEMVNAITQLKHATVSDEMMQRGMNSLSDKGLKRKVNDIYIIEQAYDSLKRSAYEDSADILSSLSHILLERSIFENSKFYFDSFDYFTSLQMNVVEGIMKQGDTVFGFCADEVEVDSSIHLSLIQNCCKDLYMIADKIGIEALAPIYVEEETNEEISVLRNNIFSQDPQIWNKSPQNISIVSTSDIFEEAQMICAGIKDLVKNHGMRYRDIGIIIREMKEYENPVRQATSIMDIPCFFDVSQSADKTLIFRFCISALTCCVGGFSTEDVLSYMKTGIAGVDYIDGSDLENYVYIWDIKGSGWQNEFSANPRGMFANIGNDEKELIKRIESTRKKIIDPLLKLKENLKNMRGAQALYEFILESDLENRVRENLSVNIQSDIKKQYDALMGALSQIDVVTKFSQLKGKDFLRLFISYSTTVNIGSIPETLDQVAVGAADRMRSSRCKVLFIAGLNEGTFPREMCDSGILTSSDKEKLTDVGIRLQGTYDDNDAKELYYLYSAFSLAREYVFMSYNTSDSSGDQEYPSVIIDKVKTVFPNILVKRWNPSLQDIIWTEKMGLVQYGKGYREPEAEMFFSKFLSRENLSRAKLMTSCTDESKFCVSDGQVMEKLAGKKMKLSPSRIDRFYVCRFRYYCEYLLKLRDIKKTEVSYMETGTIIHYALEKFINMGKDLFISLSLEQLDEKLDEFFAEIIKSEMRDMENDPHTIHLMRRMKELILLYAKKLQDELKVSGFAPSDVELEISESGKVEPLNYSLDGGRSVSIGGKIDRVDTMVADGKKYVRVVDYKTGEKALHLSDIEHGLNIQMLLYLFCIWEKGKDEYEGAIPAGVLYQKVQDSPMTVSRYDEGSTIENEKKKKMKASGLVLEDPAVIEGMDPENNGLYAPSFNSRNVNSFATIEEMSILRDYLDILIVNMADTLLNGDIKPSPVINTDKSDPCERCDYRPLCGLLPDVEKTQIKRVEKSAFYGTIEGVTHDGRENLDKTAK